jgi:hypothetical protein
MSRVKGSSQLRVMSLAVQSPDQHWSSIADSTAMGRNLKGRLGEVAGWEWLNVSRERLITRSDDGYFNVAFNRSFFKS